MSTKYTKLSGTCCIYLPSYGTTGTSCAAYYHRVIGSFGYVTLLSDTQ